MKSSAAMLAVFLLATGCLDGGVPECRDAKDVLECHPKIPGGCYNKKAYCIYGVAQNRSDVDVCNMIPESYTQYDYTQAHCAFSLAYGGRNRSICYALQSKTHADYCAQRYDLAVGNATG